jgi:hypothetical protein
MWAGGTTSLNRKYSNINELRDFVFEKQTESRCLLPEALRQKSA